MALPNVSKKVGAGVRESHGGTIAQTEVEK